MSPLEETIQEVQALKRKGYEVDEINAAAMVMLAGAALIMTTPTIIPQEPTVFGGKDGAS